VKRSRSALVALGLVVVTGLGSGVLGGCSGGDPEPRIAPSSPMSASASKPSSASGPVEPTMPAAARQHTAAGAEAFVRFYWEMADYAQATGDTSGLKPLAERQCGACTGGVAFVESVYRKGGHIHGGETSVERAVATKMRSGQAVLYRVVVRVDSDRQRVEVPGRKKDRIYGAGTSSIQFLLRPTRQAWSVTYWDRAPS